MTNNKPEHDELVAMNYCDREYKMDRPLSQYVKEAFLAGITHARSRPSPSIDEMADRFIGWPLPKTVSPDCGRPIGEHDSGTNLLTWSEAKQMFEYVLGGSRPECTCGSEGHSDFSHEDGGCVVHPRSRPEPDLRYCKHGKLKYERCIPCEPAGEFDLKEAREILVSYAEKDSTIDNGNLYFAATEFQRAYDSQPRAQTSDGEFERETGDGEESPISAKDQTEIEFHRDQVMEKMVYINKLETELAELKARMELNEIEKTLVYALSDETRQLEFHNPEFVYIRGLLSIIKRITSSRGNE